MQENILKNPDFQREDVIVNKPKLEGVQFLRFAAAFMVVVFHANIFVDQTFPRDMGDFLFAFSQIGSAGVPVFFVISGFIMFHTSANAFAQPGATLRFLTRRLVRIYPTYWCILVLYLIFAGELNANIADTPLSFVATLFLLPGFSNDIISPAWTLTYELYFYLVFGIALFLRKTIAVLAITALFLVSVIAGRYLGSDQVNETILLVRNPVLFEFLAGMYLGWIFSSTGWQKHFQLKFLPPVLLVVSLLLFAAVPASMLTTLPKILTLGVPSTLIVAWAVLVELQRKVPRLVGRLGFLGDSSYALYLIHILIMLRLHPWLAQMDFLKNGSPLLMLVLLVVASFIAGLVVHLYIEKPVLGLVRGWIARPRSSVA